MSSSPAFAAPVWDIQSTWAPTTLEPGARDKFIIQVKNLGTSASQGTVTVIDQLPAGVSRAPLFPGENVGDNWSCAGTTTVTCTTSTPVAARVPALAQARGYAPPIIFRIDVGTEAAGVSDNTVTVSDGSGAPAATDVDAVTISSSPTPFGMIPGTFAAEFFDAQYPQGGHERQAGAHPFELRVGFDFNLRMFTEPSPTPGAPEVQYSTPVEDVRTVETTLPRGLSGNPEATPKCNAQDFLASAAPVSSITHCPPETQVGVIDLELNNGIRGELDFSEGAWTRIPVYNLVPPEGYPADFGFTVAGIANSHIYPVLDATNGYAIEGLTPYIPNLAPVRRVNFTMWGVPADPAHDNLRGDPSTAAYGASSHPNAIKPFLSLPMDCNATTQFRQRVESWQHRGQWSATDVSPSPGISVDGCEDLRIRFNPDVRLQPTNRDAGAPTGLDVHLEVPQRDDQVSDPTDLYEQSGDVQAISTPPMKKAVVTMPEGMTISPSAAQGLGSCSSQQIGLGTNDPVTCPDNSQYGTLTLHTPILPPDEPMHGFIYVAKQNDNPFHDFLALYLVVQDKNRGLLVKIPGKAELDPVTGQIKTTFDDLPQFPVSDLQLTFKGGVRAALVNPSTCGTKTIKAEFFSWHDPSTPHVVSSHYDITHKPDGSPCVQNLGERPFKPSLEAGTVNPSAGSYSPFVFRLTRSDDDQEFSQLGVGMPPGLLANISGLSECSEAGIKQAEAQGRTGLQEIMAPSCPSSSQLGTTEVGAGVGVPLTYVPGKAYLAGPYRGAPLSMVVITPLQVGPYDLGVIAVRSAIQVNASTAQVSIQTDPFPQIYEGIPVRIRDIRVKADRAKTIINPTSCDPMEVTAHVTGTGGDVNTTADDTAADLATRFQAANCASLGFKPSLKFRLKGGTKRGDFPALQATLRGRPGDANIAHTTVTLPRSEFIEQGHIRTVCTRPQFAAEQCPPGSIYGTATAKSPLFDETLTGPVYLRSNGGERLLPDLVVSLNGKIDVALAGFIDSVKGRVRNTFDVVPDAPVTRFTLSMQGGKKGLLVNHLDLCQVTSRADVKMTGQNGKTSHTKPAMGTSCEQAGRHRKGKTR